VKSNEYIVNMPFLSFDIQIKTGCTGHYLIFTILTTDFIVVFFTSVQVQDEYIAGGGLI
jgi:hypothetical protein